MNYQKVIEIIKDLSARGYPSYEKAKELAIEACEKQIPKKPNIQIRGVYDDDSGDWVCDAEWYMCPTCQMRNEVYPTWRLCHYCGQMLDWSE